MLGIPCQLWYKPAEGLSGSLESCSHDDGAAFKIPALLTLAGVLCSLAVTGCLSPITLNRAVTTYDEAITDAISKQLLINIARAHQHQPIHFTGVSNIAATFDFRVNAGATPALTGEASRALMPIFGGSVAENPTISIVPIEGEEFTKRLLTPFQETKFTAPAPAAVRHRSVAPADGTGTADHGEWPGGRLPQYAGRSDRLRDVPSCGDAPLGHSGPEPALCRTARLQSDLDDSRQLGHAEGFQALQKEYLVTYSQKDNSYTLRKQITGRILITNYDPDTLSPDERARLIDETEEGHLNDVSFDIRPGHVGGEYPLKGDFRLRSFNTILNFLGRSLGEDPEYNVDKDPRTPAVHENPVHTMELLLSDGAPSGADLSIQSHGKYYAVNTTGPLARWNREASKCCIYCSR